MQRLGDALVVQRFDAGAQDAQRRAQFVRGVGGEFALHPKPLIEPVERLVDRGDERGWDLVGISLSGNRTARAGPSLGDFRSLSQRQQGAAEDRDIGDQQHEQDRQRDPADTFL